MNFESRKSRFNQDEWLCRGGECQREQAQLLSEKSNIDCRDKCPAYSLICPRGPGIMPLTLAPPNWIKNGLLLGEK